MRVHRVVLLFGLLTVVSTAARADQVDDLLAGRPVVVHETPVGAHMDASGALQDRLVHPQSNDAPFGLKLPAKDSRPLEPEPRPRTNEPVAGVQLVPEPSAFVLAVAALLYFLVFFRRWKFA